MDKAAPPEINETHPLRRFFQSIGLLKTPDTAEDLEQEIQELLEDGEEQGLISSQEGAMINSIFEFRETLAKEIMTPKTEMVCAPASATISELIATISEKGFTRIPIFLDTPDNIIGILHAKDLLYHCSCTNLSTKAGDIIKSPPLVAMGNDKIIQLLRTFKKDKVHMAIITDEFGSVRGLLTLEDILEEIVGEISDESDKDEVRWKVIDRSTVLTDAKIDIEDIEEHFNIKLPEGPYESIGGLVIHQLGHLPLAGEFVTINEITVQVISASSRRILAVKIRKD
jgi:CBS domain containing-hemolysin-like protein